MIRLYLTPIPDRTADNASDGVASQIQQSGILNEGGTSTINVSTDRVDFRKRGRVQDGETLSRKVAEELDSLSSSSYTTLPLFDSAGNTLARKRGYYEISQIDVTPAQESRDDVYEYDIRLTKAGTRESHRRAVRTNPQDVDSIDPEDPSEAVLLIPTAATDVRWYDDAEGSTPATDSGTRSGQYADAKFYDIPDAPFNEPTLTYDLPYEADGAIDMRVYDSRDRGKFAATASGGQVNTWTHVYHTGYQFDGSAVIDTGRYRVYLDGDLYAASGFGEPFRVTSTQTYTIPSGETQTDPSLIVEDGGTFIVEDGATHVTTGDSANLRSDFAAAEWNATTGTWDNVTLETGTEWELVSWSLSRIRPARVVLNTRWSNGTDEQRLKWTLNRARKFVLITVPENETAAPSKLVDLLDPVSRIESRTAVATQGLIDVDKLSE